ncbi:hypothetical protein LOK49_LG05G00671 [Camellia lanceoleosa]|uniref:Uncharacterized protein n=1 Tax=Camellia lanceoleosa TaxID=1840588 RepID=A0ACC0HPQ6_9ERIC|nr:hypothetical protein LOK49_LG05G00671 [Camellia lanceoleosa]
MQIAVTLIVATTSHPPQKIIPYSRSVTRLQKTMSCKTLLELELEEVKGFMDLGFKFSKESLSPQMMSVLPGLQRLELANGDEEVDKDDRDIIGEEEREGEEEKRSVMRPYLSEAWDIKRPDSPLLNLRLPRVSAAGDMKKHLRNLADFRMGINPGPPIMSREEFETRKADLWRKHAMESVAAKAPAPAPVATVEKVFKKTSAKVSVQKEKILELVKEVPLDPMAEKLRQESLFDYE